eukprot:CAMPEP_0174750710 /NCGR_PEP_ID=MMETSP1094-20130205/98327_1 /TAXON_ID=156173 /ORGANISM="Chrysochromulina brevifilum, Strain UTEX LB 985" /LENGTH=38 /DNA_ID= /DNA_START= /DNA_END= /DNA_ORIENTATION=
MADDCGVQVDCRHPMFIHDRDCRLVIATDNGIERAVAH